MSTPALTYPFIHPVIIQFIYFSFLNLLIFVGGQRFRIGLNLVKCGLCCDVSKERI